MTISNDELILCVKDDLTLDLDKATPYLYRIAEAVCAHCRIQEDKEDIMQEMVLTICRRNDNIKIDIDKRIFNFIFTICFNSYRDILRKKNRRLNTISLDTIPIDVPDAKYS